MARQTIQKSILSTLTLSESVKANTSDKTVLQRNKLVAKIDEQILVVQAMQKGEEYFGTKTRIERDEDGEITRFNEPKRIRKWFYTNNGTDWFLEIKYGNKVLELAKGKTAIAVGVIDNMVSVLEQVKQAVANTELDNAISAVLNRQKASK